LFVVSELARDKGAVQNGDGGIGKTDQRVMSKDLEVRHCRVLVAIADNGGIAAAARALGLAQSTISETLLSLERVLGVPVTLRRPGKEAALTPAADALLPHARVLIAASEAALAAVAMKEQAVVRLGAVESISSFLLPEPLRAFRLAQPNVDVRITIGLCEDLRKRVQRLELDAALTIEGANGTRDAGTRTLSPMTLCLVVSPHHPLAQKTVRQADLLSQALLLADPDGAFNGLMRAWFKDAAQMPRFESAGSIDGVKRGVRNSDAIGVLPGYAVAEELAAGTLVALKMRETLPAIALLLTAAEQPPAASPLHNLVTQIGAALRPANAPQ
jgi:DNA-binding transcriptional LysR family regulator